MLTSYRWKGALELNDGSNYAVPFADNALDDQNSSDSSFAYRGANTPIQTGFQVKEASFVLNISIIARTASDFEQKLNVLRATFDTRDPAFYRLSRKLPTEQYYKYIEAAPRQFTVSRSERRVSITMVAEDKTWRSDTSHTAEQVVFDSGAYWEDITVVYNGLTPAEPVIDITALNPTATGSYPLYYREALVYVYSYEALLEHPFQVARSWDTTDLVTAGKMREDGLDITVTAHANLGGTVVRVPRIVDGTKQSRSVWGKPYAWPTINRLTAITTAGVGGGPYALRDTDTELYCITPDLGQTWPNAGKLRVGGEVIAYTRTDYGARAQGGMWVKFSGLTRGADGTTARNHGLNTPVRQPFRVRVNYGYATEFAQAAGNDWYGWPVMDYNQSSETVWKMTDTWQPPGWAMRTFLAPQRADHLKTPRGKLTFGSVVNANEFSNHRLIGSYAPNSYSLAGVEERLVYTLHTTQQGHGTRPWGINFRFTANAGTTASPHIKVQVYAAEAYNFNTPDERLKLLWENTLTAGTASWDTGLLTFPSYTTNRDTQYIVIYVDGAQVTEHHSHFQDYLVVDEVNLYFDSGFVPWVPATVNASTPEQGPGTGEFPQYLSITNLSDPAYSSTPFWIDTRVRVGETLRLDCANRELVNIPLTECSYERSNWLRLVPGTNVIRFASNPGAGDVRVRLTWQERF